MEINIIAVSETASEFMAPLAPRMHVRAQFPVDFQFAGLNHTSEDKRFDSSTLRGEAEKLRDLPCSRPRDPY